MLDRVLALSRYRGLARRYDAAARGIDRKRRARDRLAAAAVR